MKNRDLLNLLNRAAAALETPDDLSAEDVQHLIEDLVAAGREVPPTASELMTDDDWIHASNTAKEQGGHFMGYLAMAFQHADGWNQPPLKAAYHTHFFRYLPEERKVELRREAGE